MGEVYVMHNCSNPELVKIGMTTLGADARAKQLRTTGVPGKFIVLFAYPTDDPRALEKQVHEDLHEFRYQADREFFTVTPRRAIEAIFIAAENRTLRTDVHSRVDVTDRLRTRFGVALDDRLRSARVEFGDYGTTFVTDVRRAGETIIRRTDLDFIEGDEEPYFARAVDASSAADLLLALDAYTLGMFTDVFSALVVDAMDKLHRTDSEAFEKVFCEALQDATAGGRPFWQLLERRAATAS